MGDNLFRIAQGLTYSSLAAAPSNPVNGDVYYDSTLSKFRKYELGAWGDMGAGPGGIVGVAPGSLISANYTVLPGDNGRTLNVDCSASAITIQLPAPTDNFKITVGDYTGSSATNFITVKRNGAELIDFTLSDDDIKIAYRAVTYISNGTDWYRIASFTGLAPETAGRGIFMGGLEAGNVVVNTIEYITIATLGNSTNFGNLTTTRYGGAGCSSSSRGIIGGETGPSSNVIDYITIATLGNAIDFGDLTVARGVLSACSSNTRGLFGGGIGPTDVIDYITIATTGNAIDFGDLSIAREELTACSSPTRGVFAGGVLSFLRNEIDYVTIATTGNAIDFGDLTAARHYLGACSSSTRGVFAGGANSSNVIDYITIATTGNAVSFGNLSVSRIGLGGTSSALRGVFAGGDGPVNVIDYITIATTGNAIDFGDLSTARSRVAACSNAHGGL